VKEYDALKNQYPEFISLDQLYRICKICKRSALYLIQHGIIPAIDTGRKTWRYKIAIKDVITYLRRRERDGSGIPRGAATSRHEHKRCTFSCAIKPGQEKQVAKYFEYIYADCDEILTTASIAEMTGLDKSTVLKLLQSGQIKSVEQSPKYLIPKQYLLDFVVTRRFLEARSNSELFMKLLGGFEIWKNARLWR
jgi:excisionase family DNA binding protein